MKIIISCTIVITSVLAFSFSASAKEVEKEVLFKLSGGRFITVAPQGKVIISSKEDLGRQRFTLIDLNGGTLEEGDKVKVRYVSPESPKATFWQCESGELTRNYTGTEFKLRKQSDKYQFEIGGGKFVAIARDDKSLESGKSETSAMKVDIVE